jgi:phosphatidate cytidylyltransferase
MNETLKRILSALVALPIYFFGVITNAFDGYPILIISLVISLLCLYEFYQMSSIKNPSAKPFIYTGMFFGALLNLLFFQYAFGNYLIFQNDSNLMFLMFIGVIALLVAISFSLQLFTRNLEGAIYSLGVTLFGVIFIVIFFSHIILISAMEHGLFYILLLNIAVMVNDIAAYFGGLFFGKHKTGFAVSPKKSWEGYFFGLLFSIIIMICANELVSVFFEIELFGRLEAAIVGLFIGVLANIGDLAESSIKRDANVKDSGSIIPGHGGVWDVFDAMIFTMPFFYYYLQLK